MEKCSAAIIDADFAIKVGKTEVINVIGDLLPQFCQKLYVHRHVFENEILFPARIKQRIQVLLDAGFAEVVDREYVELNGGLLAVEIYDATVEMLRNADEETEENGKNWGEVVSLALAKALNFPVLLSDEARAQLMIDEYLNLNEEQEDENNIRVVRIEDFVLWMRDNGLARKHGKVLWIASEKPLDRFEHIWPKAIANNKI